MDTLALGAYIALFVAFTVVVGHLLRTRGRIFLEHVFGGDSRTIDATNFLLNIGFYLLCLGILLLNISAEPRIITAADAIRSAALRLGLGVVAIAVLHSVNVVVLALLIRRSPRNASPTA